MISLSRFPTVGEAAATLPPIGALILEDPLVAPGAVESSSCPTGRNERVFVGEGLMFKVTGRCTDADTTAVVLRRLERLQLPDGDVRVEFKLVSGQQRAEVLLWFRDQGSGEGAYYAAVVPSMGQVRLGKFIVGQGMVVAERTDLAGALKTGDWNTLSVRARGADFWLSINDQPVLRTTSGEFSTGRVLLQLRRLGPVDDRDEAAVVWRNLRVSGLAVSDPAQLPTYTAPPEPSVERIVFQAPWEGRTRLDVTSVDCNAASGNPYGIVTGSIYFRDVKAGDRITARWLWNGAPIDRPSSIENWTPVEQAGSVNAVFNADFGVTELLTLVVEINGKEVADGTSRCVERAIGHRTDLGQLPRSLALERRMRTKWLRRLLESCRQVGLGHSLTTSGSSPSEPASRLAGLLVRLVSAVGDADILVGADERPLRDRAVDLFGLVRQAWPDAPDADLPDRRHHPVLVEQEVLDLLDQLLALGRVGRRVVGLHPVVDFRQRRPEKVPPVTRVLPNPGGRVTGRRGELHHQPLEPVRPGGHPLVEGAPLHRLDRGPDVRDPQLGRGSARPRRSSAAAA